MMVGKEGKTAGYYKYRLGFQWNTDGCPELKLCPVFTDEASNLFFNIQWVKFLFKIDRLIFLIMIRISESFAIRFIESVSDDGC